ncbi:exodeoxyribonuclease VII large subunit [Pseudidiomarina mangrovi]|uniref:exodeoxyribonuclease VII large subunit n=1 Tax=Pseudidiomarina mangrovi TaxID=2487133 RepID=UPI000FCB0F4F|nr:exodeoxyribonuclease VII large subunit [Pseudidiomarina mangrovi]
MSEPHIFTVASLNAEVRQMLEQGFGTVWLLGEISNFSAPSSGHWYFTLKDQQAQIKAAMFRNSNQRVRVRPQNGMQVLVRAKLTVYEPRGDYQLIVEHMEDAGAGLLQQRYEQLKQRLAAAGLFASDSKQSLPADIRRVGIITSPTGAAIRDILAVLKRRDPSIEVIIYPSAVQGQAATAELLSMLQRAVARNEVDVLILARGGGSLEDLWCFNDEQLAYALHSCPIPTISAIGHEVDFTICDFVADVRAPTPSAAAELVSQDQRQWLQQLQQQRQRLRASWQRYHRQHQQQLLVLQQRLQLQDPQRRMQLNSQRLDELSGRIKQAVMRSLQLHQRQFEQQQQRLQRVHPERRLAPAQQQLSQLQQRLQRLIAEQSKQRQQQLQAQLQQLHIVSPLQTIARGYAVVTNGAQQVIRQPQQLAANEVFQVRVAGGEFNAKKLDD